MQSNDERTAPGATAPRGDAARFEGVGQAARVGSLFGGSALALYGLRRRDPLGLVLACVGGLLAARGVMDQPVERALARRGREFAMRAGVSSPVTARRAVTIAKPRAEVYAFFRDFANLPRFMQRVVEVQHLDERTSHWSVRAPEGGVVSWDAILEEQVDGERLRWRTAEGADIPNSGVVEFRDAFGDRGTEVHVTLTYEAPAGAVGRLLATILGENPDRQLAEDLRRLKQILETGEAISNAALQA